MGVGAGLYMYVVVVQKFTFAISSPDEFLLLSVVSVCYCAYIHIYHGQLLVRCIMLCCTCLLLVRNTCTRLERINDDDDDDLRLSVCLSVCRSVCHTSEPCKNG